MLVLSRKVGERIVIADSIIVCVVAVDRSGKVRLGIEAPLDVRVLREELQPHPQEILPLTRNKVEVAPH